jgi:hypothetical protein
MTQVQLVRVASSQVAVLADIEDCQRDRRALCLNRLVLVWRWARDALHHGLAMCLLCSGYEPTRYQSEPMQRWQERL